MLAEMIPRINGLIKTAVYSVVIMSCPTERIYKERSVFKIDEVPGDNFPFIVMNMGF